MKRDVVIHSSPPTNSVRVPLVRTSVRGLSKTGRSPIKALSFPLLGQHECPGVPSFAFLVKGGISRIAGRVVLTEGCFFSDRRLLLNRFVVSAGA